MTLVSSATPDHPCPETGPAIRGRVWIYSPEEPLYNLLSVDPISIHGIPVGQPAGMIDHSQESARSVCIPVTFTHYTVVRRRLLHITLPAPSNATPADDAPAVAAPAPAPLPSGHHHRLSHRRRRRLPPQDAG